HALLGIGLVLTVSSATGRGSTTTTTAAMLVVPTVHIAILIGAETLVRQNPRLAILVGIAIVLEFAVALYLIHRQNTAFAVARAKAPAPQPAHLASDFGR